MSLTTFQTELSSQHYLATQEAKSIEQNESPITENKSVEISKTKPSFENLMARIQEASLEPSEDIIPRNLDSVEFEKALLQLPTLLKQDQAKAQRLIKDLVASAKALTHHTASSLSAVPIHPYEKLIYDYLGPNFIAPTIDQYLVPGNFSPVVSVRELEKISRKTSEIEMSQYACMSAEAMNLSFDGTFATENLNNAFAVPSVDSEGKQTFVIDKERLAEHLKFAEMVKNIPTDYIVKNPLMVAKIILSEFIRIHEVEDHEISGELVSDSQFSLHEVINNPLDITKNMLSNYQMLNGGSSDFDLAAVFRAYEKLNNLELLQEFKPKLTK
jgi:hypothetical protein